MSTVKSSTSLKRAPPRQLSTGTLEAAKKLAAYAAVDAHFPKNARAIGIGSGSTVVYVVERIKELKGELFDETKTVFVPTGFQSKLLIMEAGLKLGAIDTYPFLDVAFDGADECDKYLNCIKGGGACLFQEKLIASSAQKFVVVADLRKNSVVLGQNWKRGVPIEVSPLAFARVMHDLETIGVNHAALRQGGSAKAGPVVTDNGNFIIDADFGEISQPADLAVKIKLFVGVLEVGIFPAMAKYAYFGNNDGSITMKTFVSSSEPAEDQHFSHP